jgi:hypothetical protein
MSNIRWTSARRFAATLQHVACSPKVSTVARTWRCGVPEHVEHPPNNPLDEGAGLQDNAAPRL